MLRFNITQLGTRFLIRSLGVASLNLSRAAVARQWAKILEPHPAGTFKLCASQEDLKWQHFIFGIVFVSKG